jgi:Outer membrane protein beta-barrel domain
MRGCRVTSRAWLLSLACLAAAAPAARGQGYVGLGGGGSLPVGPTARNSAIGWNALAFLGFGAPNIPLGVRFDGAFNRFQYKGSGDYMNIWDGTANLVAPLSMTGTLVPYLIGGVGYYSIQRPAAPSGLCTANVTGTTGTIYAPGVCTGPPYGASTSAFGLNGGLGVRTWSGNKFGLFLEARFHYVFSRRPEEPFVPVVIGITF